VSFLLDVRVALVTGSGAGVGGGRTRDRRPAPDLDANLRVGIRGALHVLRELAGLLGAPKRLSAAKATEVSGWQARSAADTMATTAESLLEGQSINR
jgi:dihydroflavonol-4-reductase